MPSRATACCGSPVISRPPNQTRPEVGVVSPEMSRKNVVLPAPLGPMIERSSPRRTATSTRSTAMRLPKARVSASVRSRGASGIGADSTGPSGVSRSPRRVRRAPVCYRPREHGCAAAGAPVSLELPPPPRPWPTQDGMPTTRGLNFYVADPNLEFVCSTVMEPEVLARARPLLVEMGAVAGDELDALAAAADRHPPTLRAYDERGRRVDEIVFHPAYRAMEQLAFERFGLAAMSHRDGVLGWPGRVPHVVKYALSYLFAQSEFGLLCPVNMTDSTARMLTRFGDEALRGRYLPRLTATALEDLWQGTQWMTEKTGGYDVGDVGRGFAQMMEMVNGSRLSNAMRAAGIMRRSLLEAVFHARGRAAFGGALFDKPLMRWTLLEMLLDVEAAASVVLNAAVMFDAWDAGAEAAGRLLRIVTPLAKGWITARARAVAGEAMNVRGGNGYVEEWVNARLLRDAYLGAIWEGSTTVVALDVQRAIVKDGALAPLAAFIGTRLDGVRERHAKPVTDVVRAVLADVERRAAAWTTQPPDTRELEARPVAETLYHALATALLLDEGQTLRPQRQDHHKLLVAALYARRWLVPAPPGVPAFSPSALESLERLVDWRPIGADALAAEAPVRD